MPWGQGGGHGTQKDAEALGCNSLRNSGHLSCPLCASPVPLWMEGLVKSYLGGFSP